MKKFLTIPTLLSVLATPAVFAENASSTFQPTWYFGGGFGSIKTSLSAFNQDFTYSSLGFNWGYRYSEVFAVEASGMFSISDERDDIISEDLGTSVDTSFNTVGVYATLQNKGSVYVKGRLGLAQSRITYSASRYESESEGNFGFAYGVGVGAKAENVRFELEHYTLPDVDDPFSNESFESKYTSLSIIFDF